MLLSLIVSIIGSVLIGLQALLIILQEKGICLNDGCEIVDSLISVPPLYFNIAGFFFFLLVSFGLILARKGSETWKRFVCLLLLAALAAEAVLVSFQLFIAQTFCSYCLIVLTLIVLANIFMGMKQIFKGIVIYSTVFLTFTSLNFRSDFTSTGSLDGGSLAKVTVETSERELYLFFSSTCTYCEKVIETLREDNACSVNFNPIESIEIFDFPGAVRTASYSPEVNRSFLSHLGIEEIPVLAGRNGGTTTILTGETTIRNYLELNCRNNEILAMPPIPSEQVSSYTDLLPDQDGGCSITEECDEQTSVQ